MSEGRSQEFLGLSEESGSRLFGRRIALGETNLGKEGEEVAIGLENMHSVLHLRNQRDPLSPFFLDSFYEAQKQQVPTGLQWHWPEKWMHIKNQNSCSPLPTPTPCLSTPLKKMKTSKGLDMALNVAVKLLIYESDRFWAVSGPGGEKGRRRQTQSPASRLS